MQNSAPEPHPFEQASLPTINSQQHLPAAVSTTSTQHPSPPPSPPEATLNLNHISPPSTTTHDTNMSGNQTTTTATGNIPIPITSLPMEMVLEIIHKVPASSHLAVKLVSKSFHTFATAANLAAPSNKARAIRSHTMIEATIPRGRPLQCCICTACGLVKNTNLFSDAQAKKTNTTRICLSCGIAAKIYTKRKQPKVDGVGKLPCFRCRRAVPIWQGWESVHRRAQYELGKGLGRGFEADGVRLELGVVGWCVECLELKLGFGIDQL